MDLEQKCGNAAFSSGFRGPGFFQARHGRGVSAGMRAAGSDAMAAIDVGAARQQHAEAGHEGRRGGGGGARSFPAGRRHTGDVSCPHMARMLSLPLGCERSWPHWGAQHVYRRWGQRCHPQAPGSGSCVRPAPRGRPPLDAAQVRPGLCSYLHAWPAGGTFRQSIPGRDGGGLIPLLAALLMPLPGTMSC